MASAQAFLSGSEAVSTTDSTGRFRLTNLPLGTQTIEVRRLGWIPARLTVELRRNELNLAQVRMTDRAVLLSAVRVKGRALFHDRTGFEQRMQSGLGYYMTRMAIDARNASTFSEILRGAPGVRIVSTADGQMVEMSRAAWSSIAVPCRATYWVDGVRWPAAMSDNIDNLLQPSEIEAVEVYSGPAQTPGQFSGFGVECGTIVVWSRTPQNQARR
jgi:hypothetical protein